jgi:methylamine dehydrogenase accessory protein MauD
MNGGRAGVKRYALACPPEGSNVYCHGFLIGNTGARLRREPQLGRMIDTGPPMLVSSRGNAPVRLTVGDSLAYDRGRGCGGRRQPERDRVILLVGRVVLAVVFAVAAAGKLRDHPGAARALRDFGLPARLASPGAIALPIAELAVAALLVATPTALAGAIAALVLLGLFGIAIGRLIARGEQPDCNCFGTVHSAPVGWTTMARNLVFAALAVAIVAAGPGRSLTGAFDGAEPWVVAIGVVVAIQLFFSWQLFRQNGRLIVRMRELEERLDPDQPAASARHGLDPGEVAPTFELPDLDGRPFAFDELLARGRTLALVFSDPGCGACVELVPALARAEREREDLTVVLITTGDATQNRMRLDGTELGAVLLQEEHEVTTAYAVKAMPAAVLVDLSGRIATPLAVGGPRVQELLLGTSTPPAELEVVTVAAR